VNGLVPMTVGSWEYYEHELSVEDYFVGRGQEAGVWVGSGAAVLGLSGEVEEGQLARLFDDGRHPVSGAPLGVPYRHDSKRTVVTGFALSFSPPKSVSLVGAFGDAETAAEVREAHDSAVRAALGFLEDHAAFSRTGRGGAFQVDTHGFVAAAFTHHTSRAGDPQLHSHVLVANKVLCGDGRWRSLDGREQFAFQKAAGMLYNATLRVELSARLGVVWEPVDDNGQADIDGVPKDLIELFSKRRHDVERRAAQRIASLEARLGRTLTSDERAEQYQRATYNTRPAKTHEDETTLDGRWRTEAHVAGWDRDRWLPETLANETVSVERCQDLADPATVSEVVAELAEARSTWNRAEVAKAVARRLPPGLGTGAEAGREWIEATTSAVLAHPEVVTLSSPLSAEVPAGLRRRDGLPGNERHGASRHTTRQTLAREGKVLDALVRGRLAAVAVAPAGTVERAAGVHGLGVDQTAALRRICEGGERLVCVVGPAGAGKTRMVRAARDAWASDGTVVRGLAVSAVAAGVLAAEAGVPADTVAKFLHDTRRNGHVSGGLGSGEVVVVDEAAMLATADLAALVDVVEAADAKLVLVGDHRQLGAVEAGGLFRTLVADSRAAELHQVRRFSDPWEAAATLRLRNGDESVLDDYDAHGRITGGTREDMVDQAFTHWRAARAGGESIVVMAADHATVDALALRARAERVAAGEVEPDGQAAGTQVVGRGDEIVTTRNDRRLVTNGGLWVRNGDRWHVDDRRGDGALVVTHLDGWGRVVLPAAYAAEHVALAYAVTIHKAEGLTVDRAVLLADGVTTGEHLYVGMSRGRHDNRVCVVTDATATGHGHQAPASPVEVLTAAMRRSSAERSAIETLRDELDRGEDRDTLRRLHEHAVAHIERCAGPDRRPELRRLRQREATLPMKRKLLAVNQREAARLDHRIATVRRSLSDGQADLDILTRPRRFRRPDGHAIDDAHRRIDAQQRQLESLQRERARVAADLERNRRALRETEGAVKRIPDVQAAIEHRRHWFLAHPAELAWEADLAVRLVETAKTADPPATEKEQHPSDVDALLETLDLRTIDLSPARPRTAFQRRLDDAIGLSRPDGSLDRVLRPPPARGIDGPDLGLGL
jgi:conjugative relaxase-like TrwC/TraI family protein